MEGLNPNTTYFIGLKIFDDAGNASTLTTLSGTTDIGEAANPGDVIINEMIWKGTSVSANDEWIELRNRTNRTIDLSLWQFTKYQTETTDTVMYTFPLGTTIKPDGYLVVAEYDGAHSALLHEPDLINGSGSANDGNFGLSDTNLRIRLLNAAGTLMDIAWDGGAPPALYHNSGKYNLSMERTEIPGNGYDRIRWYPCIDEASKTDFFDGTGIDYGTPGAKNRSENEPLIYDFFKEATASAFLSSSAPMDASVAGIMTETPTITLTHDEKTHTVNFAVTNVSSYSSLSWELSYNTTNEPQGVIGKAQLSGDKEYVKTDILLATCSTGGTCTYHTGIHNLKLIVTLKNADGIKTVFEKTL